MNDLNNRRFSELSYSFAFLENLIYDIPEDQRCRPIFPSLFHERKVGYDVLALIPGSIFFFQFKVPTALVSESAYEKLKFRIGDDENSPKLKVPFLRMKITKNNISPQHEKLKKLEKDIKNSIAQVYYVTPLFITDNELNKLYGETCVHSSSGFISPSEIGDLEDDDRHNVSYNLKNSHEKDSTYYGWTCASENSSEERWPKSHRKKQFGSKKCIKILQYFEIEHLANSFRKGRNPFSKKIKKILKALNEGIPKDYREKVLSDSIIVNEYKREAYNFAIQNAKGSEVSGIRLDKINAEIAKGNSLEHAIHPGLRECYKDIMEIQRLARFYYGCELVIFGKKNN